MQFEDLEKLIKTRRAIRRWQDKPVPEKLLVQAIELATWAPNAGNKQNWRFYVILNRKTMNALAEAVEASASRMTTWPEGQKHAAVNDWAKKVGFFRGAPAGIAVTASNYQSLADTILADREKVDTEAAEMRRWRNSADAKIQSVASAIANLILILHQMGLGTVWMTGPMQAKGPIEKILKTPPEMDVVAYIPVGYPAESPTQTRRPVAEVCEIIR